MNIHFSTSVRVFFSTLFICLFIGVTSVQASSGNTQVLGFVNNCSANLPFEKVTATCGTQTFSVLTGSTNGDLGKYSITFNNVSCKSGSTVNVSAGGASGTGVMGTYFWFKNIANVDLQLGSNCPSAGVPEYSPITGGLALIASLLLYVQITKNKEKAFS